MEEPQDSRWKKGQSGNPNGRAAGSRNRATLAIEALLEGEGEALTRKAIELAMAGDMAALRLCLDRILPPRKDSPVAFDLPEMKTLNDAVPAMGALVKAVGRGDLTPAEAAELTKMVQAFAKIIETAELEERVRKLEETINK
jgi:Family of unknown function (DUF5681)